MCVFSGLCKCGRGSLCTQCLVAALSLCTPYGRHGYSIAGGRVCDCTGSIRGCDFAVHRQHRSSLLCLCLLSMQVYVYTYGSPRVGNEDFVRYFKQEIFVSYRFTHALDPTPTIPPQFLGFEHVPQEVCAFVNAHRMFAH